MDLVTLTPRDPADLAPILGDDDTRRLTDALGLLARSLAGRTMWHVNSTAQGGGVAEMLASLLPYALGAGIDVRWAVVHGTPEFFEVTKRIHNHLHETPGDGGSLGEAEREVYDHSLAGELDQLCAAVRPDDVVVLHDPQTAGLIRGLHRHGAAVVWRCHIGVDHPGPAARHAWDFLVGDVAAAHAYVFTRDAYVWDGLPRERAVIMPPCIDVLSPKNQLLDVGTRDAILAVSGILSGSAVPPPGAAPARYVGADGAQHVVRRRAVLVEDAPLQAGDKLVVQVSRWDRLKDPVGVLRGVALHVPLDDAHVVLAGPAVGEVVDDPESAEVFDEVRRAWEELPAGVRRRAHLAALPMDDAEENAAIVNALQRRADVVVQKSLAEGFGLTVAEAMWKRRPVVASRVGGMQDQVVDGESGLLVEPPDDLAAFGAAVTCLLEDEAEARRMGEAAHARVCANYLVPNHYEREAALVARLLA